MLRLTLLPLFFVISAIVIVVLAYIFIKKLSTGLITGINKSKAVLGRQHGKWRQLWRKWRQQQKQQKKNKTQKEKLPEIIQKGREQFEVIEKNFDSLPREWQQHLEPIIHEAKNILDEITAEALIEYESGTNRPYANKRLNDTRPFLKHTLDSLLQFVKKLTINQDYLDQPAREKALQNIEAFKVDLNHHHDLLAKSRKLDFDIIMDVINARLRQ